MKWESLDMEYRRLGSFEGRYETTGRPGGNRYQAFISFTLPTWPLAKRTLIPWGWVGELVRISLTIPSVSFPVPWSAFNTIKTRKPGFMLLRSVPLMLLFPPSVQSYHVESAQTYHYP